MATYYIDPVNGSNSNNGLGPDASHATNKPFATIAKAIAASGAAASGDVFMLAPGVYRESVTAGIGFTSEVKLTGDPTNASGFKTAGGVRVPPGEVRWTSYVTNDTTAPTAACLILNGRDFMSFENITFFTGVSQNCVTATVSTSTDIRFSDCTFLYAVGVAIQFLGAANVTSNWTIERCRFFGVNVGSAFFSILTAFTIHTAEYNVNWLISNCQFVNNNGIAVTLTGTPGALAYGIAVKNCTITGAGNRAVGVYVGNNVAMTNVACTVVNSFISGNTGIAAGHTSQVSEDYNLIVASTARSNVTAGANSISDGSKAALMHIGQEAVNGGQTRPFMTPTIGSPMLGFGSTGSPPTVDMLNRPRPAGGGSSSYAVGCYERHNTALQELTTVDASGSGLIISGPGDHDIQIPVNAATTTIAIKCYYDTNHGTGTKPQVQLLANAAIGVSAETKTMTVGTGTWETITMTAINPTAKGVVVLRLISRAAAGNGNAYFDSLTVS